MRESAEFDDLLAHVPLDQSVKEDLGRRMSDPTRHYHDIGHLEVLWRRHKANASDAGFSDPSTTVRIACAIAFHDSVYDGYRHDNEELSAELWMRVSEASAMISTDRQWVADTIRATSNHLAYDPGSWADLAQSQRAILWVLDLDLTPLAEVPEEFDRNTRNLRAEVPDFSETKWMSGAHGFLKRIADAPRIYRTPVLAGHYEARARANIARELAKAIPVG